jgi:hypothetical protein
MKDRDWIQCIDAPTLRITSRIDSELFKLREMTQRRLVIIDKRWDRLQDVCQPLYDTDEEDSPRGKRLMALCERAERHSDALDWRIKQIDKAMTLMEEIGEFVSEVSNKPERNKRIKAAKAAAAV